MNGRQLASLIGKDAGERANEGQLETHVKWRVIIIGKER